MTMGIKTFKAGLIVGATSCLLTATMSCTPESTISSSGDASSSGLTLTISKAYPTLSGASWTAITSGGRYYIKGTRLTITGNCDRGISGIRANEGGPDYAETTVCGADGTFTWTKTDYVGQSDKTITLTAYDVTDTILAGVTDSVNVRMDNVAPGVAVITDPAASPYNYLGAAATYDIVGTCDADVAYVTTDGSVNITPTGVNWTYQVDLTAGSTQDFHFYATDLAGNAAAVTTQQIVYTPGISVDYASVSAGGVVSGTSSFTLESTMAFNPGAQDSTTPAGVSAFSLHTGFNYITNHGRSLPTVPYTGF